MTSRPLAKIQLIEATASFTAPDDRYLSFRRGQLFYALAHDSETGYFVSTQYSTPFSRQAVNGWVPDSVFRLVDMEQLRQQQQQRHRVAPTTAPKTVIQH